MSNSDHEARILAYANENGKFAIAIRMILSQDLQAALERLQISGRVRLIDVSYIGASDDLCRIFLVNEKGDHR